MKMDEYISREELRKHLKECYDNELFDADMRKSTIGIDVYVENIPAADVQPVKRGKWISEKVRKPNWKGVEHDYFQPNSCSVCHTGFAVRSNFCPNCGARMGGDTE